MLLLLGASLAMRSLQFLLVSKICKRIAIRVGDKNDAATAATVAAIRTALIDIFLMTKTDGTIAAVSRPDNDLCFIYEHLSGCNYTGLPGLLE